MNHNNTLKAVTAALLLSISLHFAGCAKYAVVSQRKPVFNAAGESGMLGMAQRSISGVLSGGRRGSLRALNGYVTAAADAAKVLAVKPGDLAALDTYNFAVARIFSTLRTSQIEPWQQPVELPGGEGAFTLHYRPNPKREFEPERYQFVPADELDVKGAYITTRQTKKGIGAPLVVISKQEEPDAGERFIPPRVYYGVTAFAHFEGNRCFLSFEDPLAVEEIRFSGHPFPLAADFTAPLAVMLQSTNPKKLEIARLLDPGKYAYTARIARLEPYDPNKTVVLVIHGLMDSPATWTPLINTLRGDAFVRRNFQFWFYSYPSGYPYPYSAAILREQLDAVHKKYPLRKPMVVIGHSMGGCISRLLLTDTGNKLWMDLIGQNQEADSLSPTTRKILKNSLVFSHRKEVGRVIFISAPLRGSDLASNWIGRLGSKLVKAPSTLLSAGRDALHLATFQSGDLKLSRIPNSVDTLAPNNRFVKAINTIPMVKTIPYHSIAGDRGKGGNRDRTPPQMSDGVVPFWSTYLPDAKSTLIVPSNHSAHQNPQAIAEIGRILRQHAGARGTTAKKAAR